MLSTTRPNVPATETSAYNTGEGLSTGYLQEYGAYYMQLTGAVFSRFFARNDPNRYEIGDRVNVWTFSSLSADGTNYKNFGVSFSGAA